MKNTTDLNPQVLTFDKVREQFPDAVARLIDGDREGWPESEGPFPLDETTDMYQKNWAWAVDDRQVLVGIPDNDGWGFPLEWAPQENNWFFLAETEFTTARDLHGVARDWNEENAGVVGGKRIKGMRG